MVTVHCSTKRN